MVGIVSYGGYVPRYRLDRRKIFQAMGWMDPSTASNMKGEKAVANFDEDSITMAVAAGIDSLRGWTDRRWRGLLRLDHHALQGEAECRHLHGGPGAQDQVRAADFSGGLKAGTTALLAALESVEPAVRII